MPFQQTEFARVEATLAAFIREQRPPVHIRPQLDYTYVISGQSVELQEIRPRWNDPTQQLIISFAKATFIKTREVWRVYWKRADLKWHRYEPAATVATLEQFLAIVSHDEHACFYG